ncbi:MAG: hypothetical protein KME16_27420 [Scytolyngbya sp. HA4215-MV1]|nr:hypothetical protein [Scytolyngbya sp. HA4215-MV1]
MNILTNAIYALEERVLERTRLSQQTETTSHVSVLTSSFSPTITIRTAQVSSDRVTIQIANKGPGMSASVQERLFNPFFTTKPVGKGTGMGMSISYQIITEKLRGLLTCHSVLGKGTEFTIELPLRQLQWS